MDKFWMGKIMGTLEVIAVGGYAFLEESLNDFYQMTTHIGRYLIGKKDFYNEEDRQYLPILGDKSNK
jgi:hypothetical protein